jgi:hypothetical protein
VFTGATAEDDADAAGGHRPYSSNGFRDSRRIEGEGRGPTYWSAALLHRLPGKVLVSSVGSTFTFAAPA